MSNTGLRIYHYFTTSLFFILFCYVISSKWSVFISRPRGTKISITALKHFDTPVITICPQSYSTIIRTFHSSIIKVFVLVLIKQGLRHCDVTWGILGIGEHFHFVCPLRHSSVRFGSLLFDAFLVMVYHAL